MAFERERPDRYEILEAIEQACAPVELKGINHWMPAHIAAGQDDMEALRILVQSGANLSIRTEIDDYATPLEGARNLRQLNVARYLESVA